MQKSNKIEINGDVNSSHKDLDFLYKGTEYTLTGRYADMSKDGISFKMLELYLASTGDKVWADSREVSLIKEL